ncbi:hypothetical protein H5410_003000 [Solanum commersonii]|uniref:Uncharacterized protein n=1 Tax=Solanum commersonii TaxID=4109 RepID=A0A9J6B3T3_SOLCO|nr:hypothetical protein H5410_003000 [Solanum commersonii]
MRPGIRPLRPPFPTFKPEEKMKRPFYEQDQTKSQDIYMYSLLPKYTIHSPLKEPITSSTKLQSLHSVFREDSSSSININILIQTKDSYKMKTTEIYPQADLAATSPKEKERITPNKKQFELTVSYVLPINVLDKKCGNYGIQDLLKPCYTNQNYVETEDPLKTRRHDEFILTDTDSVEIEHIFEENNPDSIQYSKFTIKRILSPFEWFVDHLHTPTHLSKAHRPQTYNWYDYKAAWYNFIFVRPNTYTWFIKYSEEVKNVFEGNKQVLSTQHQTQFEKFQVERNISTLSENIKLCKFFIVKRISYIIRWALAVCNDKLISGSSHRRDSNHSKEKLKRSLKEALLSLKTDTRSKMELLDIAASHEESTNRDLLDLQGIAQAYLLI